MTDKNRKAIIDTLNALAQQIAEQPDGPDEKAIRAIVREEAAQYRRVAIRVADQITEFPDVTHEALPDVVTALANGIHVYLVGPAGSGKTTIAEQAAQALDRPFIMTGAILTKYELTGFVDARGEYQTSAFRMAYEHGAVFLWDEVDASHPGALVAFNAALANNEYTFPDGPVKRHPNFVAIAAGNTWGAGATAEYIGRNALDAATLDRFAFMPIDYSPAIEEALAGEFTDWLAFVRDVRKAISERGARHIVSPRAVAMGAKLLAAGMGHDRVADLVVWRNMGAGDREAIMAEVREGA